MPERLLLGRPSVDRAAHRTAEPGGEAYRLPRLLSCAVSARTFRTTRRAGLGIGLAISRSPVDGHGKAVGSAEHAGATALRRYSRAIPKSNGDDPSRQAIIASWDQNRPEDNGRHP